MIDLNAEPIEILGDGVIVVKCRDGRLIKYTGCDVDAIKLKPSEQEMDNMLFWMLSSDSKDLPKVEATSEND